MGGTLNLGSRAGRATHTNPLKESMDPWWN
jgi:hypothetical protein